MESTRGTIWVRRMGGQAARYGNTASWASLAAGAVSTITSFFAFYSLARQLISDGAAFNAELVGLLFGLMGALSMIVLWGAVALMWYERREFYRIIQEQERRIAQLEIEANRSELKI